jgi:predicted nucleotidyltransferase component of viral defense system
MDYEDIRRLVITALFSDDLLFDQLVLKGGNAMSLVHRLSSRVSLDLDFSLDKDFDDLPKVQARIERALAGRFASRGVVPFDVKLLPKPSIPDEDQELRWGGYELQFKLVDEERYRLFGSQPAKLRRESLVVGPKQLRTFTVDISKYEFTEGKARVDLDDYAIHVYTPAMIAVEKLRAICQQMEEYAPTRRTRRARARDFYDVFIIVTQTRFRFGAPETLELAKEIFAAKEVPLALIDKINHQREYHRPDWPNVVTSVAGELKEFDFYFDFVVHEIEPLHALWME